MDSTLDAHALALQKALTRATATNGSGPWSKELVQAIAMDIGKEVAAYIEVQYPKAAEAASSTFLLSVRNSIYNEIMAAIEVNDAGQITARIKERKDFRRKWKAAWKKIRAKRTAPESANET